MIFFCQMQWHFFQLIYGKSSFSASLAKSLTRKGNFKTSIFLSYCYTLLPNANNFAALCKIDRNILVLSCVAAS